MLYAENGAFSFRLMTCFAICIQRKLRELDFYTYIYHKSHLLQSKPIEVSQYNTE